MICQYCKGRGEIKTLINSVDFHYNSDEPVVGMEPCEECGGTGMEENWD